MKKLSLYIFLVLMWCNVGFADSAIKNRIKKIYGLTTPDLIYECKTIEEGLSDKTKRYAFNYIEGIFDGVWVVHQPLLEGWMPATDYVERFSDNVSLGWSDALTTVFASHFVTYKDEDLKSKANKTIKIKTYAFKYPNDELKSLGLEVNNMRRQIFEKKFNTMKDIDDFLDFRDNFFFTYADKLRELQEKIFKAAKPITWHSNCELQ